MIVKNSAPHPPKNGTSLFSTINNRKMLNTDAGVASLQSEPSVVVGPTWDL